MNEKKAKRLRRDARRGCAEAGVPLDTRYRTEQQVVEISDSMWRGKPQIVKAQKYGLAVDYLLSELFGDVKFARPQRVLGLCLRGVVQRTKRALKA